jgi:hypothetical protein
MSVVNYSCGGNGGGGGGDGGDGKGRGTTVGRWFTSALDFALAVTVTTTVFVGFVFVYVGVPTALDRIERIERRMELLDDVV